MQLEFIVVYKRDQILHQKSIVVLKKDRALIQKFNIVINKNQKPNEFRNINFRH